MTIRFFPDQKSLAQTISIELAAVNIQFPFVRPAAEMILVTSISIPCDLLLTNELGRVNYFKGQR